MTWNLFLFNLISSNMNSRKIYKVKANKNRTWNGGGIRGRAY